MSSPPGKRMRADAAADCSSSSSSPPAKRMRTAGSFSPPSPPYHHLVKSNDRTMGAHPATPSSPPSSMPQNARATVVAAADPSPFSPSSAPTQGSSSASIVSAPSTAPPSQSQQLPLKPVEVGEQSRPTAGGDTVMSDTPTQNRTDHDRQHDEGKVSEMPHLLINDAPYFNLPETPIVAERPHSTQNLIKLYGLDPIALSVVRKDPVTGEKINKLRKSYEGIVKDFHLSARNKAVSMPEEFSHLVQYPDEEWHIQKELGKTISKGLPQNILKKLDRAMDIIPGETKAPEWDKWRDIIGIDDQQPQVSQQRQAIATGQSKSSQTSNNTKQAQPNGQHLQASQNNTSRPPAPARTSTRPGTKRRYGDSSFEGYVEAYGDDSNFESGGEDDGRGSTKRARKEGYGSRSPLTGFEGGGSYQAQNRLVDVRR